MKIFTQFAVLRMRKIIILNRNVIHAKVFWKSIFSILYNNVEIFNLTQIVFNKNLKKVFFSFLACFRTTKMVQIIEK